MINKIYNSIFVKPTALLLAISILCMSFKMNSEGEVVLPGGTSINLETINMIRSDQVTPGQTIDLRVKNDVKVGEVTVIKAGSIAKAQVLRQSKSKGLGKGGYVELQIKSVTAVDGQDVYLQGGNVYREGDDATTTAIVLAVLVCILFLTIKGKNAVIPSGYQITTYTGGNSTIKI
jgi:hypothetical protein